MELHSLYFERIRSFIFYYSLFFPAEYFLRDKSPKEMREAVNARCAQMLATYREKCSEQAPLGQLILPECLKLLPLFANCIIKNDALCGGQFPVIQLRIALIFFTLH